MSATAPKPNVLASLRARIHIAAQQMGWNGPEYRAVLEGVTGKSSTAEMGEQEMRTVLQRCAQLGWREAPPRPQTPPKPEKPPEQRWMARPANWGDPTKNPMYRKLYAMICANRAHKWSWGYVRGAAQKMFRGKKGETVVLEWLTGDELHALVAAIQIHSNRLEGRLADRQP